MTESSENGPTAGLDVMDSAGVEREFWKLVAVVNAGVLGGSLGVILLVLTERAAAGTALAIAGIAVLGYAVHRYRALTT